MAVDLSSLVCMLIYKEKSLFRHCKYWIQSKSYQNIVLVIIFSKVKMQSHNAGNEIGSMCEEMKLQFMNRELRFHEILMFRQSQTMLWCHAGRLYSLSVPDTPEQWAQSIFVKLHLNFMRPKCPKTTTSEWIINSIQQYINNLLCL